MGLFKRPLALFLVTLLFGCGIGLAAWFLTRDRGPKKVVVESVYWKYSVTVREKRLKHGNGWRSDAPKDALELKCVKKPHGTVDCHPRQCNPHEESYQCRPHQCRCRTTWHHIGKHRYPRRHCDTCYDTCKRTVYDTCYDRCQVIEDWCSYDYLEWPVIGSAEAASDGGEPAWPKLEAREGQILEKAEWYEVRLSDGRNHWSYRPSSGEDFMRFSVGQLWAVAFSESGEPHPGGEFFPDQLLYSIPAEAVPK